MQHLMIDTVTLRRPTVTQSGTGAETRTWQQIGTYVARIVPLTKEERMAHGTESIASTHRIFMPAGTVVKAKDEFLVANVNQYQERYRVEYAEAKRCFHREHHVEVLAVKVDEKA